jgi:hypothetical protein
MFLETNIKALFGFHMLKFNSHHINVAANAFSNKTKVLQCLLNFNTPNQTCPNMGRK